MLKIGLILVALTLAFNASASTFCAVRILVTDETGKPASTVIQLKDSSDTVVRQGLTVHGEMNLCDFGFGDHSIHVAPGTCAHTVIPNIRLDLRRAQTFKVYIKTCRIDDIVRVGCSTYFRVSSDSGESLAHVSISSEPAKVHVETDEYGRALVVHPIDRERVVFPEDADWFALFAKPGYAPARVEMQCFEASYTEQAVVLKAVKP